MDPQACWRDIQELITYYWQYEGSDQAQEGIREELVQHLQDLAEWIDKGGIVPQP